MAKRQSDSHAWWELSHRASRLGLDAQSVIALRLKRFSLHDRRGRAEARRMVSEKVTALVEAQAAAMNAALKGGESHDVAGAMMKVYEKRVRANERRLAWNSLYWDYAAAAQQAIKMWRRLLRRR
jgi:hypothetical protein